MTNHPTPAPDFLPCSRCDGCGRIANDDDGTPWTYWRALPLESSLAVLLGLVRPQPCPTCGGSGRVPMGDDDA